MEYFLTLDHVSLSLGKPITSPMLIPVINEPLPTRCINKPFIVGRDSYNVTALSFGSPHGAVFVDDVDAIDVTSLGKSLGTHRLFPKGASIVFAQMVQKGTFKARLWQYGEGEKAFTAESACVAAAAAMMTQRVLIDKAIIIMGGGNFLVVWDRGADNVYITNMEYDYE